MASKQQSGLSKEQLALAKLLEQPENRYCVDCGTKSPKWASLNIGCFMCIECSGIHRQIGVHITKIKSISLDKWEQPWVDYMAKAGNIRVNAIWEAKLADRNRKPRPNSDMNERERYIFSKYQTRSFYGQPSKETLTRAAGEQELRLDQLPAGYFEGIDTAGPVAAVLSPAAQAAAAAANLNPALLRRQQKKDADDAAVKAVERAAADAVAATEAAAARVNQAALSDLLGGAPAPAPSAFAASFTQAPAAGGFGFMSAAPASAPVAGLFAGLSSAAPAAVAMPAQESTGFGFMGGNANPTSFDSGSNSSTFAGLNVASVAPVPAAGGFSFLGGAQAAAPAPVSLPTLSPAGGMPGAPAGDLFSTLNAGSSGAGAVPFSTGFSFAAPAPAPMLVQGSSTASDVFGSMDIAAALPVTPQPEQVQQAPASAADVFGSMSMPAAAPAPVQMQWQQPQAQPQSHVVATGGYESRPMAIAPPSLPPFVPSYAANTASSSSRSSGTDGDYSRLFSGALPGNMDGIFTRQQELATIHAQAAAQLMQDFQSKQKALTEAYQAEMSRLAAHMAHIGPGGSMQAPASPLGMGAPMTGAYVVGAGTGAGVMSSYSAAPAAATAAPPSLGFSAHVAPVPAAAPVSDLFGGMSSPSLTSISTPMPLSPPAASPMPAVSAFGGSSSSTVFSAPVSAQPAASANSAAVSGLFGGLSSSSAGDVAPAWASAPAPAPAAESMFASQPVYSPVPEPAPAVSSGFGGLFGGLSSAGSAAPAQAAAAPSWATPTPAFAAQTQPAQSVFSSMPASNGFGFDSSSAMSMPPPVRHEYEEDEGSFGGPPPVPDVPEGYDSPQVLPGSEAALALDANARAAAALFS